MRLNYIQKQQVIRSTWTWLGRDGTEHRKQHKGWDQQAEGASRRISERMDWDHKSENKIKKMQRDTHEKNGLTQAAVSSAETRHAGWSPAQREEGGMVKMSVKEKRSLHSLASRVIPLCSKMHLSYSPIATSSKEVIRWARKLEATGIRHNTIDKQRRSGSPSALIFPGDVHSSFESDFKTSPQCNPFLESSH